MHLNYCALFIYVIAQKVEVIKMDKEKSEKYVIPTVSKAFAVLEHIIESGTGCTFNQIIEELDLPKTSAFTVLNSLIYCNYIEKSSDKLFVPTIKTYSLGVQAKKFIIKSHLFIRTLEDLRNATGFTVFLSSYDNGEKVTVEKVDGYGAIVFRSYVGERSCLNTSASGKAIAAYLDKESLELVLSKGLKKVTETSIYEEEAFLEHLRLIRQQGYSLDNGEDDISLRCLGLPVFMHQGEVFGSVSISTTKENLPLEKIDSYISILRIAAESISIKLGFEGDYGQRLKHQ